MGCVYDGLKHKLGFLILTSRWNICLYKLLIFNNWSTLYTTYTLRSLKHKVFLFACLFIHFFNKLNEQFSESKSVKWNELVGRFGRQGGSCIPNANLCMNIFHWNSDQNRPFRLRPFLIWNQAEKLSVMPLKWLLKA